MTPDKIVWIIGPPKLRSERFRREVLEPAALLQQAGLKVGIYADLGRLERDLTSIGVLIVSRPIDRSLSTIMRAALEAGVKVFLCSQTDWFGMARSHASPVNEFIENGALRLSGILVYGDTQIDRYRRYGWHPTWFRTVPQTMPSPELRKIANEFANQLGLSSIATDNTPDPLFRRLRSLIRHRRQTHRSWFAAIHHFLFGTDDRVCSGTVLEGIMDPGFQGAFNSSLPLLLWDEQSEGPEQSEGMMRLVGVASLLEEAFEARPFTLGILGSSRKRWYLLDRAFRFNSIYVRASDWKRRRLSQKAKLILQPYECEARDIQFGLRVVCETSSKKRHVLELEVPAVHHPDRAAMLGRLKKVFFERIITNDTKPAKPHFEDAGFESNEPGSVAEEWKNALGGQHSQNAQSDQLVPVHEKLLVTINLVQDIPIALHALDIAASRNLDVSVIVGSQAVENGLQALQELATRSIGCRYMEAKEDDLSDPRWLEGATMLFCPSESSAISHALTHELTSTANRYGVRTFTVQNGFEQAGLTIEDPDVGESRFNSSRIFTWQHSALLPSFIPSEVRARCRGVGRFIPSASIHRVCSLQHEFDVGIFENLHWGRYNQDYRRLFIERCCQLARDFPDRRFILQPHPAGRWAERLSVNGKFPKNLRLAAHDQTGNRFERTAALLASIPKVISSPSTILVDAAEAGCGVAVVAHGQIETSNYEPLTCLRTYDEWAEFVNIDLSLETQKINQDFLSRIRLPERADDAIFDEMLRRNEPAS